MTTSEPTADIGQIIWPGHNNPDDAPLQAPLEGHWAWWRQGEHPKGGWVAVGLGPAVAEAVAANRAQFPIMQDRAIVPMSSDFGGLVCHACGFWSDGYPEEPGHRTKCDGICRRRDCTQHNDSNRQAALNQLTAAINFARSAGLTISDIQAHVESLAN